MHANTLSEPTARTWKSLTPTLKKFGLTEQKLRETGNYDRLMNGGKTDLMTVESKDGHQMIVKIKRRSIHDFQLLIVPWKTGAEDEKRVTEINQKRAKLMVEIKLIYRLTSITFYERA